VVPKAIGKRAKQAAKPLVDPPTSTKKREIKEESKEE